MSVCATCGIESTTLAHVKDKSVCIAEGISDHLFLNVIDLCYNCHYTLFDERRMGIKNFKGKFWFVYIDYSNKINAVESKITLNVKPEYIFWKNSHCFPRLKYILNKDSLI
jgi:hypothetical protein